MDSLSNIEKIYLVKVEGKNVKQKKQQAQYRTLLAKAEPIFDLSKYHSNFITAVPDAKVISGRPSYFVVKDTTGKRYGEYSLSSLATPLPIDANLWVYLTTRLSHEIATSNKAQ